MTQITLNVTDEQLAKIEQLAKEGDKSLSEQLEQIVNRGIYDVSYRRAHNKKAYNEFREWKALQKGK